MLKAFYESAIAESAAENILNDCAGQYIAKHNKPAASSLVGRWSGWFCKRIQHFFW